MLKVCKFGGTSLADGARFAAVKQIVTSDPARRVIVVSAGGKRHALDYKITDALYLCYAHLQYGFSCWPVWKKICRRMIRIRDDLRIPTPIERELDTIYASLGPSTPQDWLVSRGEYLTARLMADYLGYSFLDAENWLQFDADRQVRPTESYAALRQAADGKKIVTPGFYGRMPNGEICTFSRGGSDITGSLAAVALDADLCENWTDVAGILEADPALVPQAKPVEHLSFDQLALLTEAGMQVLHESAVAPLREKNIPLRICSSFLPELDGTGISNDPHDRNESAVVAFAGRKTEGRLSVLCTPAAAERIRAAVRQADILPVSDCYEREMLNLTVPTLQYAQTLQTAYEAVQSLNG